MLLIKSSPSNPLASWKRAWSCNHITRGYHNTRSNATNSELDPVRRTSNLSWGIASTASFMFCWVFRSTFDGLKMLEVYLLIYLPAQRPKPHCPQSWRYFEHFLHGGVHWTPRLGEDQDCSEPSGKEDEAASKARISVVADHAEGEKEDPCTYSEHQNLAKSGLRLGAFSEYCQQHIGPWSTLHLNREAHQGGRNMGRQPQRPLRAWGSRGIRRDGNARNDVDMRKARDATRNTG